MNDRREGHCSLPSEELLLAVLVRGDDDIGAGGELRETS